MDKINDIFYSKSGDTFFNRVYFSLGKVTIRVPICVFYQKLKVELS